MTTDMIIVLALLVFVVTALLTHIVPYGVAGMICCVTLVLTGVFTIEESFASMSSGNCIMVACMIVVASALGKLSFIKKLQARVNSMKGNRQMLVLIIIFAFTILLSQFMGSTACLSIMVLLVQTLDPDSDLNPGRVFFAVAVMNCLWVSRIPIGMGVAMTGIINSLYSGMVPAEDLLSVADFLKVGIIPSIIGTVYCLLFYRLLPKTVMNEAAAPAAAAGKDEQPISTLQEGIIWLVFAAVTIGFMFQDQLGSDVSNIIPAAGVLVMILFKVLPVKQVTATLASDMIFMVIGMQTMSSALTATGVDGLIGQLVLKILGGNPSGFMVITVFCLVATIMTNFMNNMGTMAVLIPIAASTAMAGGFNVQNVVLVVAASAWMMAFVLPTGSSAAIMGFGMGNHNTLKTMRFSLPLIALLVVSLIICSNIFYPIG